MYGGIIIYICVKINTHSRGDHHIIPERNYNDEMDAKSGNLGCEDGGGVAMPEHNDEQAETLNEEANYMCLLRTQ